jgi:hemerythrin
MPLIRWSEKYSVNVRVIDAQHRQLIVLINTLHDAMMSGTSDEVKAAVLTGLVGYAKKHFTAEERLLSTQNYPEYAAHRAAHEVLTQQVEDMARRFHQGQTTLTVELMDFLRDWLVNHIMGTDKRYSAFLNNAGVV